MRHTTPHAIASLAALTLLAIPSTSSAQEASDSAPIYERGGIAGLGLTAGLKGSLGFGQVYDTTGLGLGAELELGWVTPYRPVQVFVSGAYKSTGREGGLADDPRLAAQGTYTLAQAQGIITLGALYRLPFGGDLLRPYAALGARVYLTSTEVTGASGDEPFGDVFVEQGTDLGAYGALGVDVFIGPGSILAEINTGWAPVGRFVLQDTSTGMLDIAVGYRMFF